MAGLLVVARIASSRATIVRDGMVGAVALALTFSRRCAERPEIVG